VVSEHRRLHLAGVSDHAPVVWYSSTKPAIPPGKQTIPKRIFRLLGSARAHDASEFQQTYSRAKAAAAEESFATIERDTPAAASANSKSQQQKGVRRLNGRRELDSLPSLLVAPGHLCGDIVASLL